MASTTASGSSPLTCSTGDSIILTTSVQYSVERLSRGSLVVKPIWLLMTMCTVPPVRVAARLRQRQRFLFDALAGKGGIAVHQHGQHLFAMRVVAAVHAGAHRAFDHRVDDFQVRRVERQASGAPGRRVC